MVLYSLAYPLELIFQLTFAQWHTYAHHESNETHNAERRYHLRSSHHCLLPRSVEDQASWLETLYQCHISFVKIPWVAFLLASLSHPILCPPLFFLHFSPTPSACVPSSWLRLLTLRSIHIKKPPEISISIYNLFKIRKNCKRLTYSSYSYPLPKSRLSKSQAHTFLASLETSWKYSLSPISDPSYACRRSRQSWQEGIWGHGWPDLSSLRFTCRMSMQWSSQQREPCRSTTYISCSFLNDDERLNSRLSPRAGVGLYILSRQFFRTYVYIR